MKTMKMKIFFLILLSISLYLVVFKLPFPGTDDIFFKQPGVNLIRGRGFSAPGVTGCLSGIEKIFVQYPPVYPFIFGIWFLIFGFSISSSLCLSFLICGSIAFIQVLLFETILNKKLPVYIYGLIFFSWSVAVNTIDRPDALLVLLGLGLLLLIIRKASKKIALKTRLIIILLMGLALGTSPYLGALLMLQLLFVLISVRGFNMLTMKTFSIWCSFAILLCALLWGAPLLLGLDSFKSQVVHAALFDLKGFNTLERLKEALKDSFRYGNNLFYIPLIVYLILLFTASTFFEIDKRKRNFLLWQFHGIIIIWALITIVMPRKYYYWQAFFPFFVFICGIASVRFFENLKNPCLKNISMLVLFLCLGISYLPFLRIVAFPSTWEREDTYAYNKKLILENVPKNSTLLTDRRFWYIFDKDYKMFDLYIGCSNIHICDYVILVSGGSGRPEAAPLTLGEKETPYFYKHFVKQLNTMSNEPNKLLRLPISRSRWCYRFELYKRR